MSVAVRVGTPDDLSQVEDLYREWGYRSAAQPTDTLIVAEHDRRIVGVVRLLVENGVQMLRGMRIQPAYQRTGLGTQVLKLAEKQLNGRECYGIPYSHLLPFYARIGFAEIAPGEAPQFLVDRAESYRAEGLSVVIIRRPGA